MNRQDDKISDVQQITEMVDALGNTTEVKGATKKKVGPIEKVQQIKLKIRFYSSCFYFSSCSCRKETRRRP